MAPFTEQLNFFVALAALLMQAGAFLLLVVFLLRKKVPFCGIVSRSIERWGLHIAFLLFAFAAAISLYYSEVLGFTPCGLCWAQRIFMYPQVVLLAVALWKKESRIADYSIALSVFGAVVGLYQHYLQMGGPELVPCPAAVAASDCAKRIIFEFGYITFPLVGFSMLAFAIILMFFVRGNAPAAAPEISARN